MVEHNVRFDDGVAYEQMMGAWSRLAGQTFLDWLEPPSGLRWIDIGCGNGAFTELLVERCSPFEVQGIDPSQGQLAFAQKRTASHLAKYCKGDAMALPFADSCFDAAVMALTLVFVPDPAKGVSEMARVVRPGGVVAAYTWDMLGGGFPLDPIILEMQAMGIVPPRPPRMDASRMGALRDFWAGEGLENMQTRKIAVSRTFADFDDFWITNLKSPSLGPTVAAMQSSEVDALRSRVRMRMPASPDGHITCGAHAHAVMGRRPNS